MGDARSVIDRFYPAFNDRKIDESRDMFAPDVETIEPGLGTMKGVEAFLDYARAYLAAVPDGRLEPLNIVESGEWAFTEGRFTGTQSGPMVMPQGTLPATNRAIDLRYADIFHVRDGRIASHHTYYDQVQFLT